MNYGRDFESACRASKQRKAVGNIKVLVKGQMVDADIIKPLYGNAEITWADSAYPIRTATTKEVDMVRYWRPYV